MLKDAQLNEASGIGVGVTQVRNADDELEWTVFLFNLSNRTLESVFVSSRGYGSLQKEEIKTSQLRHYFKEVQPKSYHKIEPIMEEVFGLNNQYWVSYYHAGVMYEKKYIFLPETIQETNFIELPLIEQPGVFLQ